MDVNRTSSASVSVEALNQILQIAQQMQIDQALKLTKLSVENNVASVSTPGVGENVNLSV